MRRRVEHQHVGGALAQDCEPGEAVVVGDCDDAVAVGLERLLQHCGVAAARAHEQRTGAVAARIGQRRQAPLDVGHEHDHGPAAGCQGSQRGLAATRAVGQRHRHRVTGRRGRPGGAEPRGRRDLHGLPLGPRHDLAQHEPRRQRAAPVVDLEAADDVVTRTRVQ